MATILGFTAPVESLFESGVSSDDLARVTAVLGSDVPASLPSRVYAARVEWFGTGAQTDLVASLAEVLAPFITDSDVRRDVAGILALVDLQPSLPIAA